MYIIQGLMKNLKITCKRHHRTQNQEGKNGNKNYSNLTISVFCNSLAKIA